MSEPYHPHSGRKKHLWRIRKQGFREFVLKKSWDMKGAYGEKIISGRQVMTVHSRGDT